MKIYIRNKVNFILKLSLFFFLYQCGQSIGYKKVDSEFRYYFSTDPEWLPSAKGPGGKKIFRKLENVNENSFEILGDIAKDSLNVWFKGKPILRAHAKSFVILEGGYQKDQKDVYHNGKRIKNARSHAFEIITVFTNNDAFATTDQDVYFKDKPLLVTSVLDFELIPEHQYWSKDGHNYFFLERKITVGNYNEIDIISETWFKDNKFVFNVHGDTLLLDKNNDSNSQKLDISSIKGTAVRGILKDKFGYIRPSLNKRISKKNYEFFLKHND